MHNTHIVFTAAILGSAGYTGQETLDRILSHPGLELIALGSETLSGRPARALHPGLNGNLPIFTSNREAAASGADVIFVCLGNEEAAAFSPPAGAVVVDLTGVHRLRDDALAERWYGLTPGAWSYGLPEVHRAEGPLIANPGCYATASLLALAPLRDVVGPDVIVDAKSGMTGAGRTLRDRSHAGAVLENFAPYAVVPVCKSTLNCGVCLILSTMNARCGSRTGLR